MHPACNNCNTCTSTSCIALRYCFHAVGYASGRRSVALEPRPAAAVPTCLPLSAQRAAALVMYSLLRCQHMPHLPLPAKTLWSCMSVPSRAWSGCKQAKKHTGYTSTHTRALPHSRGAIRSRLALEGTLPAIALASQATNPRSDPPALVCSPYREAHCQLLLVSCTAAHQALPLLHTYEPGRPMRVLVGDASPQHLHKHIHMLSCFALAPHMPTHFTCQHAPQHFHQLTTDSYLLACWMCSKPCALAVHKKA